MTGPSTYVQVMWHTSPRAISVNNFDVSLRYFFEYLYSCLYAYAYHKFLGAIRCDTLRVITLNNIYDRICQKKYKLYLATKIIGASH